MTAQIAPIEDELLTHAQELVMRLRIVVVSIIATAAICLFIPLELFQGDFSLQTYTPAIAQELLILIEWSAKDIPASANFQIILGSPISVILAYSWLALIDAVVLNIPLMALQIYRFLAPGLYEDELNLLRTLSIAFAVLFVFGMAVGFWLLPIMMRALIGISSTLDYDRLLVTYELSSLVDFIFWSVLVTGAVHTYPVFIIGFVMNGALTSEELRKRRREVVAGLLALTALITPDPTPFSMLVLSAPLLFLYEVTVNVAMKLERQESFLQRQSPLLQRMSS